ncbi:RidA family protein [Azorhizobium oxalatiphilum]|nr:RidA family protein [Azorhizobium oxalatiphilum]
MSGRVEKRLAELGIVIPEAGSPRANYVPFVNYNGLVFISGQGPRRDGALVYAGKVGAERTPEEAYEAARICAINLIAHLKVACDGDLDRVQQVVRLAGIVNCVPEFDAHPQVINGASDLICAVFGDAGRHARIATGTSSLPSQMTVEIEGCFGIAPA